MEQLTHFQRAVLADILQSLRLDSVLYCRALMGAPWGLGISRRSAASFHIVTAGRCWLSVEGGDQPVLLTEGDLVILPHGHAHCLTDDPDTPVTLLEDLVSTQPKERADLFRSGGAGAVTTLVCGGIQLVDHATNPLFSILPPVLHIGRQHGRSVPQLRAIVRLVKAEAGANPPEAEAVITRLSEILFIQAVRAYLSTASDGQAGWFGALRDPQIGRALALIQRQPDEAWSVASLARDLGLSRSAFAAKFTLLVGESPMRYLTHVRLTKAAALLRTQQATVREVARSVGYESEVALSKAFKRYFGIAPGAYRQGKAPASGTYQQSPAITAQTDPHRVSKPVADRRRAFVAPR